MAKTNQRKLSGKRTGKKVASFRRSTPAIIKRNAPSGRLVAAGEPRKAREERVKVAPGAVRPAPPREFASAGMIDDSELQSTDIKKYIRTRLGDRS